MMTRKCYLVTKFGMLCQGTLVRLPHAGARGEHLYSWKGLVGHIFDGQLSPWDDKDDAANIIV